MRRALFLLFASAPLGLCFTSAARAQQAGATEVTVVRETLPEQLESFPRHAFLRLRAAGAMPVTGPRAEIANVGGSLAVAGGAHFFPALAVGLEIELGTLPESTADGAGKYTTARVSASARVSVPVLEIFHAFGAFDAGVVLVRSRPASGVSFRDAAPTWSLGASAGLELDAFDGLSVEGGLRAAFVRTSAVWQGGGDTLLLCPFVGASWFF